MRTLMKALAILFVSGLSIQTFSFPTEMERCNRATKKFFKTAQGKEILNKLNNELKEEATLLIANRFSIDLEDISFKNASNLGFVNSFWSFKTYFKFKGVSQSGAKLKNTLNGAYIISDDDEILDQDGSVAKRTCYATIILKAGMIINRTTKVNLLQLPRVRESIKIYER